MDSASKIDTVSGPPPETTPDPVLVKMLEVAPSEEGEGENRETTASTKEAFKKRGDRESLPPGGEEDRFRRSGGQGLKAGEEIFIGGSCARRSPGRTISLRESALQRAVSRKKGSFIIKDIPIFASEDNRSFYLVVRISALLS